MKINQILKFARYHFDTGYIAADSSGIVFWYLGEPILGVNKEFWCNNLDSRMFKEHDTFIKLICTKYEVDGSNWLWSVRKI